MLIAIIWMGLCRIMTPFVVFFRLSVTVSPGLGLVCQPIRRFSPPRSIGPSQILLVQLECPTLYFLESVPVFLLMAPILCAAFFNGDEESTI